MNWLRSFKILATNATCWVFMAHGSPREIGSQTSYSQGTYFSIYFNATCRFFWKKINWNLKFLKANHRNIEYFNLENLWFNMTAMYLIDFWKKVVTLLIEVNITQNPPKRFLVSPNSDKWMGNVGKPSNSSFPRLCRPLRPIIVQCIHDCGVLYLIRDRELLWASVYPGL